MSKATKAQTSELFGLLLGDQREYVIPNQALNAYDWLTNAADARVGMDLVHIDNGEVRESNIIDVVLINEDINIIYKPTESNKPIVIAANKINKSEDCIVV